LVGTGKKRTNYINISIVVFELGSTDFIAYYEIGANFKKASVCFSCKNK